MSDPNYFDHRQINRWRDESKKVKLLVESASERPEVLDEIYPVKNGYALGDDKRVILRLMVGDDPISASYFNAVEHFVGHIPSGMQIQRGMKRTDFVAALEGLDDIPEGLGTQGLTPKEAAAFYQRLGNMAAIEDVALGMQRDMVKIYRALKELVLSIQQNGGTPSAKVVVNAARALREVSEDDEGSGCS